MPEVEMQQNISINEISLDVPAQLDAASIAQATCRDASPGQLPRPRPKDDQLVEAKETTRPLVKRPKRGEKRPYQNCVFIKNALIDIYCWYGIKKLYGCGIYFMLIFLAMWMHTETGASAFKSSIITSFNSYDTGRMWEQSSLNRLRSMSGALQYMIGYMSSMVRQSSEDLPHGACMVNLGGFAHVTYAQLKITLQPCSVNATPPWNVVQDIQRNTSGIKLGNYSPWNSYILGGRPNADPAALYPPNELNRSATGDTISGQILAQQLLAVQHGCISMATKPLDLYNFPGWGKAGASENIRNLLLLGPGGNASQPPPQPQLSEFRLSELSFLDLMGRLNRIGVSNPSSQGDSQQLLPETDNKTCSGNYRRTCVPRPPEDKDGADRLCFCAHNLTGLPYTLRAYMNPNNPHDNTAIVELVRLWPDCVAGSRLDEMEEGLSYLLAATRSVVAQYGTNLELAVHAFDQRNNASSALLYLQTNRVLRVSQLDTQTLSLTLFSNRYSGTVCMVLVIVAAAGDIWFTLHAMQMSYMQRGYTLYLPVYFLLGGINRHPFTWHMLDVGHHLGMAGWIIMWFHLHAMAAKRGRGLSGHRVMIPQSAQALRDAEEVARVFTSWLYDGIALFLLAGLRCLKHIKYHAGLRTFWKMFKIAYYDLLEFAVFVFGISTLLCSVIFGIFIVSGGNPNFSNFGTGLSTMTRLSFGFLGFDEFVRDGNGLGSYSPGVEVFFWLSVLILVLIVQNTLLAIFANAYDKAKLDNVPPKTTFLLYALYDTVFWYYRFRWVCTTICWFLIDPFDLATSPDFEDTISTQNGGREEPRAYWTVEYRTTYMKTDDPQPNMEPQQANGGDVPQANEGGPQQANGGDVPEANEGGPRQGSDNKEESISVCGIPSWHRRQKRPDSKHISWSDLWRKIWWRLKRYALEAHARDWEKVIEKAQKWQTKSNWVSLDRDMDYTNSFAYHMLRRKLCYSSHMAALVAYFTDYDMARLNVLPEQPSSRHRVTSGEPDTLSSTFFQKTLRSLNRSTTGPKVPEKGVVEKKKGDEEDEDDEEEVDHRVVHCMWRVLKTEEKFGKVDQWGPVVKYSRLSLSSKEQRTTQAQPRAQPNEETKEGEFYPCVDVQFHKKAYEDEVMQLLLNGPVALAHDLEKRRNTDLTKLYERLKSFKGYSSYWLWGKMTCGSDLLDSGHPTGPPQDGPNPAIRSTRLVTCGRWILFVLLLPLVFVDQVWTLLRILFMWTRWNPFWPFRMCTSSEDDEHLKKLVRALVAVYGPMPESLTVGVKKEADKYKYLCQMGMWRGMATDDDRDGKANNCFQAAK